MTDIEAVGDRLVGSDRVLAVLVELASHPSGATLDEMVRVTGSPKSTVHRALASLRRAGLASQDGRGHYILGDEFLRLAFTHHEARPEHVRVRPLLERLAERFGEAAHFAVMDGTEVVYRAKVEPPIGAVRLTSAIGGRNPVHSTGVGKALLALQLSSERDVASWIGDRLLEARTPNTAVTAADLHARLDETRRRGYAIDDQENELGINCVAFPVYLSSPTSPAGAVSVSALAYRTPLPALRESVDEIRSIIAASTGIHERTA